jgi:isopenicillin N synthase-like dioxygenase
MNPFSGLKTLFCLRGANLRHREEDSVQASKEQTPPSEEDEVFLPPLRLVTLPKVLPIHQPALSEHGWSTVTYEADDALYNASEDLFRASKAFFDLPAAYKEGFKSKVASEEGWTRVEGEKEFLTLRNIDSTPPELKEAAAKYWAQASGLLNEILGKIAESLGLPSESLTVYSNPSRQLDSATRSTMLRLFRYEGFEGKESKIVAEGKMSFLCFCLPAL